MWASLFPGQGSQVIGMGRSFYDNFSSSRELFEEASDTLSTDFKKLCFEGPESDLTKTENTQPALLLVSTCAYRALRENIDVHIQASSGHSVGEYAAVVAAGSVKFAEAIRAVRLRGQAMQSAVPLGEGGMLAVMGLSESQVDELCAWAVKKSGLSPVEPANYNSPGQIVISGSKVLTDWMQENVSADFFDDIFAEKPKRLKLIPLNVSAPFHSSMMKKAEKDMTPVLSGIEFTDAEFPVVQNVTAKPVTDASELRKNLVAQITAPVKWIQCVNQLADMGVRRCIELGSGKVLQGLVKKIDSERLKTFNIQSVDDFSALEAELKSEG